MKKLEVIAWSLDDAIQISKSKAHRIELISEMDKGGLTPSLELVKNVINSVDIPVRVMIRDKHESFVYDDETMKNHIEYIKELKKINPEGIVFGSLTKENKINFDQLNEIIKVKGDMKLTFHRAFDEISESNFIDEFDKLSKLDVDTLLTSGLKQSALIGKENIKNLIDKKTIKILPGKSISIENAKKIIDYTNADFIHVGYSVRDVENINGKIVIDKINSIIEEINSNEN